VIRSALILNTLWNTIEQIVILEKYLPILAYRRIFQLSLSRFCYPHGWRCRHLLNQYRMMSQQSIYQAQVINQQVQYMAMHSQVQMRLVGMGNA